MVMVDEMLKHTMEEQVVHTVMPLKYPRIFIIILLYIPNIN